MRNEVDILDLIETSEALVEGAPVKSSSIEGGEIRQLIENKDLNFSDGDDNY